MQHVTGVDEIFYIELTVQRENRKITTPTTKLMTWQLGRVTPANELPMARVRIRTFASAAVTTRSLSHDADLLN